MVFDPRRIAAKALAEVVEDIGFEARLLHSQTPRETTSDASALLLCLSVAGPPRVLWGASPFSYMSSSWNEHAALDPNRRRFRPAPSERLDFDAGSRTHSVQSRRLVRCAQDIESMPLRRLATSGSM